MSRAISQEQSIWSWFLVHMCKNKFIFIFSKFWFSGFSKFINKCKKEILRCVPPSLHVCDFFSVSLPNPFRNFICNVMLLVDLQDCYIHTYQILFQMFHFSIASYQFPSMSSKWVNMSTSREVDRRDDTLT